MATFLAILTGCATGIAVWALGIAYSAKNTAETTFKRLLHRENSNLDWMITWSKEHKEVDEEFRTQLKSLDKRVGSIESALTAQVFTKTVKGREVPGYFTLNDLSKGAGVASERYEKIDDLVFTYDPDTMQFKLVEEAYVKK